MVSEERRVTTARESMEGTFRRLLATGYCFCSEPNPCPLTPSPGDPDAGLELRPEFIVSITSSIERHSIEYAAGKRGKSLDEVIKQLGLE